MSKHLQIRIFVPAVEDYGSYTCDNCGFFLIAYNTAGNMTRVACRWTGSVAAKTDTACPLLILKTKEDEELTGPSKQQLERAKYELVSRQAKKCCGTCCDYHPNEGSPQIGKCHVLPTLFSAKAERGDATISAVPVEYRGKCRAHRRREE